MTEKLNVAVVGDGGWGTALGIALAASGCDVRIWGHDPAYLDRMNMERVNSLFLPGIAIPPEIGFEPDLPTALGRADMIVSAVPGKFLRSVWSRAAGGVTPDKPVLSLTKGLDAESMKRPSEVIAECLGSRRVVALSGPSHAEEVARGLPASVVVAAEELEVARRVQRIVSTPRLRVYASRDMIGVEIAGAIKNVIALAAGILHGMGMGDNALAALATRGLVEMTRLGVALGAEAATFSGLAGMGDLITTCVSPHGRNRAVGIMLAEGRPLASILESMNGVPESVTTTEIALRLAERHHVDMPITREVGAVLWHGKSPERALHDLMNRARKDED